MSAKTLQSAQVASGVVPRAIHAGTLSTYGVYSLTATLSTGDVIEMCKVPNGAIIHDIKVGIVGALHVNAKMNVGTAADHDQFIMSASCNATRIFNMDSTYGAGGGLGYKFSLSDSAATRYSLIKIKISDADSVTGTNAGSVRMLVQYSMDTPGAS